ncbi:hypothetical protein [Bradyrhizobium sp. LMG 9283]|uniref:hypothetical protein n=1 Tax=Bradyrhizobium sp. LMG 9283 TaxID=592064 RepID=UPI00388F9960
MLRHEIQMQAGLSSADRWFPVSMAAEPDPALDLLDQDLEAPLAKQASLRCSDGGMGGVTVR